MPKRPSESFEKYSLATQNRILRSRRDAPDITFSDLESERSLSSTSRESNASCNSMVSDTSVENTPTTFVTDYESECELHSSDFYAEDAVEENNFVANEETESDNDSISQSDENNDNLDSDVPENCEGFEQFRHEDSSSNCSVDSTDEEDNEENIPCDMENNDADSALIYDGAPISVMESFISILVFAIRHKLTGACLSDLLRLLQMHCLQPNLCAKTVYKFKQYFSSNETPLIRQFYCPTCLILIENDKNQCVNCTKLIPKNSYFINIPITQQILKFYERPGFREKLTYEYIRQKENQNNLEDLLDGNIYKSLSEKDQILSDQNNIALCWYTDGIAIYRSSKFNVWPFFFTNLKLSPLDRYKPENLIMGGLWFGEEKPIPNLFLLPLRNELQKLYNGINVGQNNPIKVRGIVIAGTCDAPAKSLFLNMTQYNGKFGCVKCKLKGESNSDRWTYPYEKKLNFRTDLETQLFAARADHTKVAVYGVKGSSVMQLFVHEPIRSTGIDIMHCIFSGVTNQLLNLWFSNESANENYSIKCHLKIVDSRISLIKPPFFIQRRPRTIENHLNYWKTSELKNWFFYISIVVLKDILPKKYYKHHKLLVSAIFLLCKTSISHETIAIAKNLLHKYVKEFENLYSKKNMSFNVHQLLHLPQTVEDLGPLWTVSCFPYENIIGKLKYLVHSSNAAQLQICNSLFILINSFKLISSLPEDSLAYNFCKRISLSKNQLKSIKIDASLYVIGTMKRILDVANHRLIFNFVNNKNIFKFLRLLKGGYLYTSEQYLRQAVTCSKYVKYVNNNCNNYGVVKYYFKVSECECRKFCLCNGNYYALIKKLLILDNLLKVPYNRINSETFIYKCEITDLLEIINVKNLLSVCFFLPLESESECYIAEPINLIEDE